MSFIKLKNYIPNEYIDSIQAPDFHKLYDEGFRLILTDLDNTLISYKENLPTKDVVDFLDEVKKIGFHVFIISNSRKHRVDKFAVSLGIDYVRFAKKPLKLGFKKFFKKTNNKFKKEEILYFGDQLMTDILGGRRMHLKSYLVKAIDRKTERRITKFNRFLEKIILKRIKRKYPTEYQNKLSKYVEDAYGKY